MADSKYTVRQGRKEDIAGILTLMHDEGLNDEIDYLRYQFEIFTAGVFVAENFNGEIISHCSSIPLNDSTGFIGLYITKGSWRGKGIGRKVFDLSYKALGTRQVALNTKLDLQGMYASVGFKISTYYLTIYECPIKNLFVKEHRFLKETYTVSSIKDTDFQKILAYDKKIHPTARTKTLKWFIEFAYACLIVTEGNEIKGWGSLSKSHRGFRLEPLYADSLYFAKVLLNELIKSVMEFKESTIEVSLLDDNQEAKKMYEELGIVNGNVLHAMRMFTKYEILIPSNFVYSLLNYHHVLA